MRKAALLLAGLLLAHLAHADVDSPTEWTEADGSPSVYDPWKISVSNGSLTDNGDGSISVTTSGGGSSSLTVGVTTISAGSSTKILFEDSSNILNEDTGFTYNPSTNKMGVNKPTPLATVHAGADSYTLGNPSNLAISGYTALTSGGIAFGASNSYSVYGKRTVTRNDGASKTFFSTTPSTVASTAYSIVPAGSSGVENYSGTGYTADGSNWDFTVYPLYSSDTNIGSGASYTVSNDSSFNPFSIDHTINAPTWSTPSNYIIVRTTDDMYQIVSGSFSDSNDAWNADATTQLATYTALTGLQIDLTWTAASSADDYRIRNTTNTTWTDKGSTTTSITDNGTWTSGTPTLIPTGTVTDFGLTVNGGANIADPSGELGFFGTTPAVQQTGNVLEAMENYGLVTTATAPSGSITGTANQAMYFDSSGNGTSNGDFRVSDDGGVGFGFTTRSIPASTLQTNSVVVGGNLIYYDSPSYDNTSSGTKNNFSTANKVRIKSNATGTTTFTGFSDGYPGKVICVANGPSGTMAFDNQSSSSTAANRIITGSGATITITTQKEVCFDYDGINTRWLLRGGDREAVLSGANSWTGSSNSFSSSTSVIIQGPVRWLYVAKSGSYSLTSADANIQFTASGASTLTLYAAAVASRWHKIINTGSGTVTINTTGSDTLSGYSSGQYKIYPNSGILITDGVSGTGWRIEATFTKPTTAGEFIASDANGVPISSSGFTYTASTQTINSGTVNFDGGTIDGTRIGSSSAADATFTYVTSTGGGTFGVNTLITNRGTVTVGGANIQTRVVPFNVSTTIAAATTTTGQNCAGDDGWTVDSALNGFKVTTVLASVTSVNTSGTFTANVRNRTNGTDILSTAVTIDATELTSATAATPAVINQSNNTVSTGDDICVQVSETGTGHSGARVSIGLNK